MREFNFKLESNIKKKGRGRSLTDIKNYHICEY